MLSSSPSTSVIISTNNNNNTDINSNNGNYNNNNIDNNTDNNNNGIFSCLDLFMLVPSEIVMLIMQYLSFTDLLAISQVNKEFTSFATEWSIWKQLCISHVHQHAHCAACVRGVLGAANKRADVDGVSWMKIFKEGFISFYDAKWGVSWENQRIPTPIRIKSVEYLNENKTVRNVHGGWNVVQFGEYPLLPFGVYHYSYTVDHLPCNGMMLAVATTQWHGVYPGSGNSGITSSNKTTAYYSHNPSIFATGDTICLCVDIDKRHVVFHKNGEIVGTEETPQFNTADGEELCVVGAFCGNFHQLSVVYANHT